MQQERLPDLTGKVAVVTGGGGVLCAVFSEKLAKAGARVAILDLNLSQAQGVAEKVIQQGGEAIAVACNVIDKQSILQAEEQVKKQLGRCDILVNGAGGNHPLGTTKNEFLSVEDLNTIQNEVSFFDLDATGIGFVFDLNFMGTLLPTQIFSRDMVKNGNGTVINISSMNALKPLTKIPAYSAAKAAVSNFTQWLAVHLSKVGIRVNAIAPGFFLTEQNKKLLLDEQGNWTDRSNKVLAHTPMGRMGKPEELTGTLMYLVDDNASQFVTGVVIPVDGGFSAYSGV